MERLTDKEIVKKLKDGYFGDTDKWEEAYLRLAELEDKIENGTLVELPAPLGSELWTIEYPTYKKGKETVTVLSVKNATVERTKYPLSLSNLDMVGKYYFLTREEAEKRLEELKK